MESCLGQSLWKPPCFSHTSDSTQNTSELPPHLAHRGRQTRPTTQRSRDVRPWSCASSPVVEGDLQAQLIHKKLHYIITLPMKLQGSPVILRGPLKTGKVSEDTSQLLVSVDWSALPRHPLRSLLDLQDT